MAESRALLTVQTKCDCRSPLESNSDAFDAHVSAFTGGGLPELKDAVAARLSEFGRNPRELVGSTAARCRESLRTAAAALDRALAALETAAGEELLALEIRDALEHLGQTVGAVYTDDILDRIFSKFCIGK
jgi:tRNA modification GTPase